MQISFLSFSTFAGFRSLDDKGVINTLRSLKVIAIRTSFSHPSGSLDYFKSACLILNTFAVSRLKLEVQIFMKFPWKKESNNPSILIKLLSQKK